VNGLSLFTGSGIGELAFKQIIPDYKTVGYVEIDRYCRAIIRARIRDGILDDAPVFDDIREFNRRYASCYAGKVDWISGGFPCQPFSVAGRRAGEADERNMWPATRDAISIIRPRYALLENVPGLLSSGYFGTVVGDLAEIGYDCEWDIIGASDVGAPHRRKRIWILGYTQQCGFHRKSRRRTRTVAANRHLKLEKRIMADAAPLKDDQRERRNVVEAAGRRQGSDTAVSIGSEDVPNTESTERESASDSRARGNGFADGGCDWWATEPDVGGVINGLA